MPARNKGGVTSYSGRGGREELDEQRPAEQVPGGRVVLVAVGVRAPLVT